MGLASTLPCSFGLTCAFLGCVCTVVFHILDISLFFVAASYEISHLMWMSLTGYLVDPSCFRQFHFNGCPAERKDNMAHQNQLHEH